MVDSKENYKFNLGVKGLRAIPCYRLYIQRPIFLETNFLNKLILHSFELLICSNTPHRVIDNQQRKNFLFFNRGCQYFCVKLLQTLQKNQPTIQCVHLTLIFL